ncbi:hypothetical protein SAMN04488066_103155 [Halorubrum aquaticum]|uniref:DUF5305 domain-containing protein n=1 Tax=Halorubrum aquaticum TaxID=387340 RepID=A0A1I2ZUU3_9EURY|nr:DUF5305 domain-containing protein [Halorubrum aquaticum]SFH41583.1 hypothetical protein SAMN04488066_103155 [Halorubrum aquaticum]
MSTLPDPDDPIGPDGSRAGPDETRLRARAFLDAQFSVLLVVCLLVAAAGGGLVYTTHVDPGTETQTRTVSSWNVETEYVHSAEVTEPSPVFSIGDELTNRETYFASVAPELDVAAQTTYTADSAESVDVTLESTLVVRNVGGEESGTVYWEQREAVDSTTATDVGPGETVSAPFTLNSTAIDERVATIEEELGASPGETETFVVTDVEVAGTLNGENVTYTRSVQFGISHEGATYTVSDPGVQSDGDEQQVTETVERTYGPLRGVGGPLTLLVGLLGVAGLGYARYEGLIGIDEAEREYLSFRDDRSEFDEWITRVRLPPEAHDRPEAYADGLRDLVDFAIDNDTGVVEDPNTGAFHAVSGEFVYTYRPPLAPGFGGGAGRAPGPDRSGGDGRETAGSDANEDGFDGDESGDDEADAGLFTSSLFGDGSDATESSESGTASDEEPDDGSERDEGPAPDGRE